MKNQIKLIICATALGLAACKIEIKENTKKEGAEENSRFIPYKEAPEPQPKRAEQKSKNVIINFQPPSYPVPNFGHPKEGTVHYAAYYTTQGHLKDTKIVKTSGHSVLDEAVLKAIKRTVRLDPYSTFKSDDVVVYFTCIFEGGKVECGHS